MRGRKLATVVIIDQPTDEYGDPVGEPTRTRESGWKIAPREASESEGGGVYTGLLAIAPFDTKCRASSRVQILTAPWDDGTYDVVAKPARWRSPYNGREPGAVIALEETT